MSGTSAVNQAETFVFLDIETTGFRDPKITELAMLVMPREDFMPQRNGTSRRALNKWTSLFNPDKPIEAKASEITGKYLFSKSWLPVFCLERGHALITSDR